MSATEQEQLYFNGVDGTKGGYLLPPTTPENLARMALAEPVVPEHAKDVETVIQQRRAKKEAAENAFALAPDIDPRDLAQTGWGIIWPPNVDAEVKKRITPLVQYRKDQAGARFHEYTYAAGEDKVKFLERYNVPTFGLVDPDQVPYYLLIVGDPDEIPYSFQLELDVAFAVGRIHFDTPAGYEQYAANVIQAEKSATPARPRRVVMFGAQNGDDPATTSSVDFLVNPLAQKIATFGGNWSIESVTRDKATKAALGQYLGGPNTPALLFTASHGMRFRVEDTKNHPRAQGALLCSDLDDVYRCPGPDEYFCADDVPDSANLTGLIAFHFACFGGGTPRDDEFAMGGKTLGPLAKRAFVAGLPKRLLSHPQGALAVVGHVERAWGSSFLWKKQSGQLNYLQEMMKLLLKGYPVGEAARFIHERYADLASVLFADLNRLQPKAQQTPAASVFDPYKEEPNFLYNWIATKDTRGFAIIGDPAVRLRVAPPSAVPGAAATVVTGAVTTTAPAPSTASVRATETFGADVPAPSAPPATPAVPVQENYGWFGPDKPAPEGQPGQPDKASVLKAFEQFVNTLGQSLQNALQEAATLKVVTYVSDDLDVNPASSELQDLKNLTLPANARMCAMTWIELDGDTKVCVPRTNGQVDDALWQIHLSMVKEARENRAELMSTLISAAKDLIGVLKLV